MSDFLHTINATLVQKDEPDNIIAYAVSYSVTCQACQLETCIHNTVEAALDEIAEHDCVTESFGPPDPQYDPTPDLKEDLEEAIELLKTVTANRDAEAIDWWTQRNAFLTRFLREEKTCGRVLRLICDKPADHEGSCSYSRAIFE